MATRLYFHAAANSGTGTFPSGEQATATATVSATGAATAKTMDTSVGASQAALSYTSSATTARQWVYLGMFISPTLNAAQTVGGGAIILNGADSEANLASNAWLNALNVYVWRPGTGTKVGTVRDSSGVSLGGTEPTVAPGEQVTHITGITSSAVSAAAGDVIVCELWIDINVQSMGSAYANTVYYDGTTVNTTENSTVSNHASFIELAETLTFGYPNPITGSASAVASASAVELSSAIKATGTCVASASATGMIDDPNGARARCVATAQAGLTVLSSLSIGRAVRNATTNLCVLATDGADRVILTNSGTYQWSARGGSDGRNLFISLNSSLRFSTNGGTSHTLISSSSGTGRDVAALRADGMVMVHRGTAWTSFAAPYTAVTGSGTYSPDSATYMATDGSSFAAAVIYNDGFGARTRARISSDGVNWSSFTGYTGTSDTFITLAIAGANIVVTTKSAFTDIEYSDPTVSTALAGTTPSGTGDLSTVISHAGAFYTASRSTRKVWKSANGVTGWTHISTVPGTEVGVELHETGGAVVLVAKTETEYFYVSRDAGLSWERRGGAGANLFKITGGMLTQGVFTSPSSGTNTALTFLSFTQLDMATSPPMAMLTCASTASATLTNEGVSSPFFPESSFLSSSSATAVLLTAHDTKLYMDGPRQCVATATATLTEGATQWIGRGYARADAVGPGVAIKRNGHVVHDYDSNGDIITLPSGRWMNLLGESGLSATRVSYSDDKGLTWRDTSMTNQESGRWIATNGTRLVSRWVSSGDDGKTWSGTTWSTDVYGVSSNIAYGNGKFVCFVNGPNALETFDGRPAYSTDGINWTVGGPFTDDLVPSNQLGLLALATIFWMPGLNKFVALTVVNYPATYPDRSVVYHSTDGIAWTRVVGALAAGPSSLVGEQSPAESNGASMIAGQGYYSTDGGLNWTASAEWPGDRGRYLRQLGGEFFIIDPPSPQDAYFLPTRAWRSTDANRWTPVLLEGRSMLPPGVGMFQPGRTLATNGPIVIPACTGAFKFVAQGAEPVGLAESFEISRASVLTATGTQPTPLFGTALGTATKLAATMKDMAVHALGATVLGVTAAQATALTDASPFVKLLAAQATATGAMTTAVRLAGKGVARSKPRGSDVSAVSVDFFAASGTAVSPITGLVVAPNYYRSVSTLQWAATPKPDAVNAPFAVASDGLATVCALMTTGPVTYSSSNGSAWTLGTAITAPPGGWGAVLYLSLVGAGGKFLLCAGTDSAWYSWVSANGRSWSEPVEILPEDGFTMSFAATADGFYGVRLPASAGETKFFFSSDGASWVSRTVAIDADPVAALQVSAGTMAVKLQGLSKTVFFDTRAVFSNSVLAPAVYPDDDGAVPGDYFIGDAHSARAMFYRVGSAGVYSRITDPLEASHVFEPTVWTLPAGNDPTGDFVVSDGSLYARMVRTSDSASIGVTANMGVALGDYVEPPGAIRSDLASTSAALATLTTSIRLAAGVIASASASASELSASDPNVQGAAAAVSVGTASLTTGIELGAALVAASSSQATTLVVGATFAADVVCAAVAAADLNTQILLQAHAACTAFIAGALRRAVPLEVLYEPLVHTSARNQLATNLGTAALFSSAGHSPHVTVRPDVSQAWATSEAPTLLVHQDDPEITVLEMPVNL